jgi:hypothetical protein
VDSANEMDFGELVWEVAGGRFSLRARSDSGKVDWLLKRFSRYQQKALTTGSTEAHRGNSFQAALERHPPFSVSHCPARYRPLFHITTTCELSHIPTVTHGTAVSDTVRYLWHQALLQSERAGRLASRPAALGSVPRTAHLP